MFVAAHGDRCIATFLNGYKLSRWFFKEPGWGGLADQNIFFRDNCFRINHTVFVEVLIRISTMCTGNILFRDFNPVDLPTRITSLFTFVRPEEMGTSQPPLNGCLIEDESIFDIVPLIGKNCNDKVLTCRAIIGTD